MTSRKPVCWVLLGVCAVGSCAQEGPSLEAGLSVRDSAGIAVVESGEPLWEEGLGWRIDFEPELAIGELRSEEDPGLLFVDVTDLDVLPDGTILVADIGLVEVLVFDATGRLVRRIGREGDGPGEFRGPRDVFACADGSLMVLGRTLDHFDAGGEFIRRLPMEPRSQRYLVSGTSPDCTTFLVHEAGDGPEPGERGVAERWLSWSDSRFQQWDTFATVPVGELYRPLKGERGVGLPLPWTSQLFLLQVREGRAIVGWGDRPEWRVFAPNGALERIVRWSATEDPVTASDRQQYRDRHATFVKAFGKQDSWYPPLDAFPDLPTNKPYYDRLMVDHQGRMWLRKWPPDYAGLYSEIPLAPFTAPLVWRDHEWTVFDPSGRWLGVVTMPPKFQLFAATARHVYGVQRDSLDVPVVKRFRIIQTPPPS